MATAVPKAAAVFPGIETENWTRWIDENYIYKHHGQPNPYYGNIDTATVDSDDSIKQHARERQNINNREYANKFNNKDRPTTYFSKSIGDNARQTFNNILDKPNDEIHYSSEEQY
ncbi:3262_t:CDS:2 [Gigaspora margarita]|uniref:3262_t:CDS:1 n=1 Tax=Gigaspora margarita TaxID=4874 RepID=A0ABM8W678_GIGMA|nr:3262_t:CDS:2 [Gigaspora margarita]